ncbi:outer membrane protein OmpU [Pseudooceanicola antarcticus]|uniref:Outer membrane protein OmpU n=1 Tax=Pseudooceanicola antarcticus TaxID=1247613 RepID=A0A285HRR8_9RHOB|nr:porin [Pseudooceanicola antarcticus]PJE27729.1 porin [Pseudooceanicola antarcticus]SNY37421.1 outer membrane protein OmpU [Pseudooceanicola antarcticus]
MKKILFASTALVVTAGAAAADITLSGSANMGLYYDGTTTIVKNEIDFGINASATTDSGIEFGASIDLDAAHNDSTSTQDPGSFDPEVYISSGGLTLTVGDIGEAADVAGLADVGFDELAVDDDAEGVVALGSHDVSVAYSMGDYSFGASFDSASSDWGVSVSGSASDLSFALGYAETAGADNFILDLSYDLGDVTVGAVYLDGTAAGYGFDVAYTAGDLTVTFVYGDTDAAGDEADYGVGAAYDLGSGLGVAGGLASVNGTTVADFGVTMSF